MTKSARNRFGSILKLLTFGIVFLLGLQGGETFALQNENGSGQANKKKFVEGRVLVKFRPGAEGRGGAVVQDLGADIEKEIGNIGVKVLKLQNQTAAEAVARTLSKHADVEFVELDEMVEPSRIPNDPYFSSEWHLSKIAAPQAWDSTIGNSGMIIAVLDTGVDASHADLAPKMIPGWNTYDNNSNTADVYGHGTAVAGTIAAVSDNSGGVASLVWNCLIMPVRISDPSGYANYSDVAEGFMWAADRGARVANLSYAMSTSATVQAAAKYFQDRGGVVTMSAGNSGLLNLALDNPYVLTVSATDSNDSMASWSNIGNLIDVAAPGVGIYTSNRGGGYSAWSGTSFSAPIVAGVAALVLSVNPGLSGSQVQSIIRSSADDRGLLGWDTSYGHGRVNAARAVSQALSTATDTTPPSVSFASPANGATISGQITVQVNATDNAAVSSVSLKVDGANAGSDSSSPYTFSLNTSTMSNGVHTLSATATDSSGVTRTVSINVTVSNTAADATNPSVWFNSPGQGASVNGNITVAISASDNVGVVRTEIWINGSLRASSAAATLSTRWNTRNVASGTHQIIAKAFDAAGNEAQTTITVYK